MNRFFLPVFCLPWILFADTDLCLQHILLSSKPLLSNDMTFTSSDDPGIHIADLDLPGNLLQLSKKLEPFYQGRAYSEVDTQAIKQEIYKHYRNHQRPFVLVSVLSPECNVLPILVEESKLGKLEITGNKWTKKELYEKYFKTQPGDPLVQRQIATDVNFMNRNPYRSVDLAYSPGSRENTTDITLNVHDRRAISFYAGCDNTGVPTTGRGRVFAGFHWDQFLNLDSVLFYQYTTNYDVTRYHSNLFQYTILLPNKNLLDLYGGFSVVHASLPTPNMKNHGRNIQGSIRYKIPIHPSSHFSQEIIAGFDLKNTNNTMEFVNYPPTFGQIVNISQFIAGYKCKKVHETYQWETEIEITYSPGRWLPHQSTADFASLRPGASNKWIYGRANYYFKQRLAHSLAIQLQLKGQLSSNTLLPSEELGIGGYDSVRGYDARQYDADSGLIGSFELHSPPVCKTKSPMGYGYFLLFVDGGYGSDYTKVPSVPSADFLVSTGIGARYFLDPYITARADLGVKLHEQTGFTGGLTMFQFSLISSY
jgi:hemolysin activation/secretion protein